MENTERKNAKIVVAILAILLLSSMAMLLNSGSTATAQDYGDIMQYDWPQGGSDEGNSGFNAGPGPDKPNVLWKVQTPGSGMVSVFNGKAFVITGYMIGSAGRTMAAFDALTGQRLWVAEDIISISGVSGVHKLDDNYLFGETTTAMTVIRISDGKVMWEADIHGGGGLPGSGSYFAGHYSDSMKKYVAHHWDEVLLEGQILCYDLSDPTVEPPLAWTYVSDTPAEILCSGDGRFYLGSTESTVIALDGETGERVWDTSTNGGLVQQSAMYYNGRLYTSAVNTQMTCFDGETGNIKWQKENGPRAFSAYRGCAGDGMVFDTTIELDPHGAVRAWDAETGEPLWTQPAYFNIAYTTMAYADGKVYTSVCDQSAGIRTGGLAMPGYGFGCFDAYTGTMLWRLDGVNFATPSIAYGNLYGLAGGYLWCIGGEPADWTHGFVGNVEQPRVAVGQSAPADISTPKWAYQTGGDVLSSPAVVDGKVYVGSHDKNWYCLDAYTGEKIWNFTIGFYVRTSCAVVNGRVFTGADDGNFYCLDADTGEQIWKTGTSKFYPGLMVPTEFEPRSSPIVVGSRLYVGSLDGKVYCLSTSDGDVEWTYNAGMPVIGTPAYSDGTIYITVTDWYLYALNAADGSLKWKSPFTLNLNVVVPDRSNMGNIGTPTVADGIVVVGGGCQYGTAIPDFDYYPHSHPDGAWGGTIRYMAFDAETGESVWNQTRAGNTQPGHVPTYFDGQIYAGEFFYITSMDIEEPDSGSAKLGDFGLGSTAIRRAGNRTWAQWVGYQVSSSVAYADDPTGPKVYVGCDIGSLYCIDAETGQSLSVFTTKGNVASSPAVWNGRVYVGSDDGNVYCFDDSPVVDMSIFAESNKGTQMWNTETLEISGALQANPIEYVWNADEDNPTTGAWVAQSSSFHPGLPNAEVQLYLTKPDGSDISLTTTTDEDGNFAFSYSPTEVGEWGWVINYEGETKPALTYGAAYGEWNPISVNSPTEGSSGGSGTELPPATFPMEYVYAAIAVIIVGVVAFLAYFILKKK